MRGVFLRTGRDVGCDDVVVAVISGVCLAIDDSVELRASSFEADVDVDDALLTGFR